MKKRRLNIQERRMFLTEELYNEVTKIQNKPWKPFWRGFSSFSELARWKKKQEDPRLW